MRCASAISKVSRAVQRHQLLRPQTQDVFHLISTEPHNQKVIFRASVWSFSFLMSPQVVLFFLVPVFFDLLAYVTSSARQERLPSARSHRALLEPRQLH